MKLNQKQIAQRIQFLMKEMKFNQKQMAELLQITQPAVSKYLKERIPPPSVLLNLAQSSGTTIEWILTGVQTTSPKLVSDNKGVYNISRSLVEKVESLPPKLQKDLNSLIDTILLSLNA